MPAAVAIPIALGAGTATAGVIGAKIQSNAAKKAADTQAASANYAADVQAKSNAESLAFQREQAAQDLARANALQEGNYNQWAAREGRLSNFGQMLGLPARTIPPYVPIPGASGGAAPSGANYQPLIEALNKGQSPDAVIASFNKSQGLPNGASYAWRSIPGAAGGGVVEIPGGSYLSPTGQGGSWVWSAGDSARSGSPKPSSYAAFLAPQSSSSSLPLLTPALSAPNFASYLS